MTQPICDLVLLSWNHLEQTQPCLDSLFETTGVSCRLFIVDNGSEPSVRAFLASVKPRGAITEVVLLQNEINEGFPRGMNRGIQTSTAPFVCLLNNDLRFTEGWLEGLIAIANSDRTIGVINPTSNTFGNVPPAGMSLTAYAQSLRRFHGRYTEVGMCIGFCMLVTRPLLERIGGLSEEVERIFFEDEDFCMRAQAADYRCVVAAASYVYHAEHQSVQGLPEREALFSRNQRWCEQKWGRRIRIAWPRFAPLVPGSVQLREYLECVIGWVRRRTHVYAYCPMPAGLTADALIRTVGLVPHADIHWRHIPPAMARWMAAGLILQRRKKPFDIIVAPELPWGKALDRLRWWHGAVVVLAQDEEQLTVQWKRRSLSPLSS